MKAINRRVVLDIEGEYKDLNPVADFVARLSESITKFLDRPIRWDPPVPDDAESEAAFSQVQRAFSRLHEFVDRKLPRVPRQEWMRAFDYSGHARPTTARVSPHDLREFCAHTWPVLGPHSENFLAKSACSCTKQSTRGGGELVSDVLRAVIKQANDCH